MAVIRAKRGYWKNEKRHVVSQFLNQKPHPKISLERTIPVSRARDCTAVGRRHRTIVGNDPFEDGHLDISEPKRCSRSKNDVDGPCTERALLFMRVVVVKRHGRVCAPFAA